jgi:hypothetical protein
LPARLLHHLQIGFTNCYITGYGKLAKTGSRLIAQLREQAK